MVTQTIQAEATQDLIGVIMELFTLDSDTIVASAAAPEESEREGLYVAVFTNLPAGTYRIQLVYDGLKIASGYVKVTFETKTFTAEECLPVTQVIINKIEDPKVLKQTFHRTAVPAYPLPNTASIFRRQYYVDPDTQSERFTLAYVSSIDECHMQQLNQNERERWLKREPLVTNKLLTFAYIPDARSGDIIRINTNNWSNSHVGEHYEFVAVDDTSSASANAVKLILRKIENLAGLE